MKFLLITLVIHTIYLVNFGESGGYGSGPKKDTVLVETVYNKPVYDEPKIWKEPEYEPEVIKDYGPKEVVVSKGKGGGYGAPKSEPIKVWKEPEYEPEVIKDYGPKEVVVSKGKGGGYGAPKSEPIKVWKEPVYEKPEIWKEPVVVTKVIKQPVIKIVKIVEPVPVYKEKPKWKGDRGWNRQERWIRKQQQKYGYGSWKRDTSAVSFLDESYRPRIRRSAYYGEYEDSKQLWKKQKQEEKWRRKAEKKWRKKKGRSGYGWVDKRELGGHAKVPKIKEHEAPFYDDGEDYDKQVIAKEIHKLEDNFQHEYERKRWDQDYDSSNEEDESESRKDYGSKEVVVIKENGSGFVAPKIYGEESKVPGEIDYGSEEAESGNGTPEVVKKIEEKVIIKKGDVPSKAYEEEPETPKEVLVTKEYGEPKVEKVIIEKPIPPSPKAYEEPIVSQKPEYVSEIKDYGSKEVTISKGAESQYDAPKDVKPIVVEEVKEELYPVKEYVTEKKTEYLPPRKVIQEKPDHQYKEKEIITTTKRVISVPVCNKLMDGLLENLQPEFLDHMSKYSINHVEPIRLGRWGQIQLHDGHMNQMGRICRKNDFKATSWGKGQYLIEGEIQVPEPKCEFMADARMYNKLRFRNQCIRMAAKDAKFKVAMLVNKPRGKVHVAELEPLDLNGFHLEDEYGQTSGLKWPFTRVSKWQLEPHKQQFMEMLTHELCDKFREMIHRPEVTKQIISQV